MCEAPPSAAAAIPGPVSVLGRLVAFLARRVVWPILVGLAWWHSGMAVLPRRRRYARRVHAAGRCLGSAVLVLAVVYGAALVGAVVAAVAAAVATAAVVVRRRARARTRPVRVPATVTRRAPVAAITHQPPGRKWTATSERTKEMS